MEAIATRVQQIFAELTRYPIEILEPDADLEQDLGIDSVKRGEIMAVLAKEFDLPPASELPLAQTWTIGVIARTIAEHARGTGAAPPVPVAPMTPAVPSNGAKPAPPPLEAEAAAPQRFASPPAPPALWSSRGTATSHGNGHEPAPKPAEDTERRVLQTLLGVIQETLTRSERPAVHRNNGAGAAPAMTSTRFLPEGHRPFEGRVALITGSGRGLGKVMANQLADLGARVIVNSFFSRERGEQVTAEINARGGDAIHLWGSVANPGQLAKIFEDIDRRYGYLDFFVQNASNGLIAPLDQITDAHWEKAFRTNVVALHQGALLAAPLMRRRGGGKIVTISSPGAHHHIEHFGCIGPVKAAVESLVVYLAVELGRYNIQVNALSAGPLYGELMDQYPDSQRLVEHWEARAPDHRLGEEREVSNNVMFLLSDLADKTSGAVLLVDGASSRSL
jgi:NAD(P)-dependent dehydrogenase (short-subunit alcohol dehydrogenase family)/acyl carrier protein